MPHIFEPRPAGPAVGDLTAGRRGVRGRLVSVAAAVRRAPETSLLVAVAAILNLWALGRNDWANTYYAGAVRSMASSWHAFLYASLDRAGVMTVDKPPLSLWVQALSVRVFGFHPLAILVPQALMGIASVLLVYDLVRRRFGRLGGFAAGLALATTPIFVAMSRDNNPDALLTLCCLAAVWFAVRAFEDARTRWIVLCGVAVGLGFEAKMLIALVVVPVAALAWLWITPRGRGLLAALRRLLWGGVAMLIVGGAWPLLVALTPAADRPFVSGTSDNTILSLIFGYNGLGRVTGQTGGPARFGGVGGALGQVTGPLRLVNAALGGQGGWLLGLAVGGAVAVLVASRARRRDPRTAWLAVVGGAFVVTGVIFSYAGGIFHPYYVVLLAPFTAALVGAGVATVVRGDVPIAIAGPALLAVGVVCELLVGSEYGGQLSWMQVALPLGCGVAAVGLLALAGARGRGASMALGVAVLLIAPAIWAVDTLGYATPSTFPAGGPAVDNSTGDRAGCAAGAFGSAPLPTSVWRYVEANGGGTIGVSSQGEAACSIIAGESNVAGLGGFSGEESDPSVAWLASEVADGNIRWVDTARGVGGIGGRGGGFFGGGRFVPGAGGTGGPGSLFGPGSGGPPPGAGGGGFAGGGRFGGGLGGASGYRPGASAVLNAAAQVCTPVASVTVAPLYDCAGRAAALRALG